MAMRARLNFWMIDDILASIIRKTDDQNDCVVNAMIDL
jgi:hypothetical protein